MDYERMPDETVITAITMGKERIQNISKAYNEGIMSRDEGLRNLIGRVMKDCFEKILERNGLLFNSVDYEGLVREFDDWKNGIIPDQSSSKNRIYYTRAAFPVLSECPDITEEEKEHVFRMIDGIGIPLELFDPGEPIPEDVICPMWEVAHPYHDVTKIRVLFNCKDDGGLFDDPDPRGKTYTLTDDRGLHAVLRILSADQLPEDSALRKLYFRDDMTCRPDGYVAEGFLEGYTYPAMDHQICVNKEKEDRTCFSLAVYANPGNNELENVLNGPIWSEYNKLKKKHGQEQWLCYNKWFNRIVGLPENDEIEEWT